MGTCGCGDMGPCQYHAGTADGYADGLTEGAENERKAIVAWLRAIEMDGWSERSFPEPPDLADSIEKGEHHG